MFSSLTDTDGDPPNNWIYLIVAIIVVISIAYLSQIPTSHAGSIGAYDVVITPTFVGGAFKDTSGLGVYTHRYAFWKNINPATGHKGVLRYEEGPASYTSPEGLWYATDTDMDWCGQTGKSHDFRGVWLIPYTPTQLELAEAYGGFDKIPLPLRKPLEFSMGLPPIKMT